MNNFERTCLLYFEAKGELSEQGMILHYCAIVNVIIPQEIKSIHSYLRYTQSSDSIIQSFKDLNF